jgi:hypothetical protein
MRISTLGSPRWKPIAARRKESALKGVRRKGKTDFTGKSGLLILIERIMRAWSRVIVKRSMTGDTTTSLAVWRPRMVDHIGKGLDSRNLAMRGLVEKGVMRERSFIDQGDTKRNLNMTSLDTTSMTRR